MKIAICLSGELRSINYTWIKIQKHILYSFPNYDVFYHTWTDDPDIYKLNTIACDGCLKDILIEPRKTFDEKTFAKNKRDEVNIQGMLRQLYCLKTCNELKTNYEKKYDFKYDFVLRLRPDILPINDTYLESSETIFKNKDSLIMPNHDNWYGYNDRIYGTSSEQMNILSNRIDLLDSYYKMGGMIHYETFFKYVVDLHDIPLFRTQLQSVLLRTSLDCASELIYTNKIKNSLDTKLHIW